MGNKIEPMRRQVTSSVGFSPSGKSDQLLVSGWNYWTGKRDQLLVSAEAISKGRPGCPPGSPKVMIAPGGIPAVVSRFVWPAWDGRTGGTENSGVKTESKDGEINSKTKHFLLLTRHIKHTSAFMEYR